VFPLLIQIAQARKTEIPQKELDEFMRKTVKTHMPSRGKGTKQPDIMGIHQINANPPVFEMLIKYRTSLHRSYINFVENQLRQQFDFTGTPLIIKLVKMKR
jgi:GTP-binding protein